MSFNIPPIQTWDSRIPNHCPMLLRKINGLGITGTKILSWISICLKGEERRGGINASGFVVVRAPCGDLYQVRGVESVSRGSGWKDGWKVVEVRRGRQRGLHSAEEQGLELESCVD